MTLFADEINLDGGFGTEQQIFGCRAFCRINSSKSIQGSGNISSITNNGTGDATFNFSTNFPSATYSPVTSTNLGSGVASAQVYSVFTSSVRVALRYVTYSAYNADMNLVIVR